MESGRALSQASQYERALTVYEAAYSLFPVSWLYINIGRIQYKLGRYSDAIGNFKRFLEAPGQPGDEAERAKATEFLHQAQRDREEQEARRQAQADAPRPVARPLQVQVERQSPVYKRWWLGLLLGSMVTGIAAGVTVWLATRPPPAPMVPDGFIVINQSF